MIVVKIRTGGLIVKVANLFMKIKQGEMLATTIHKTIYLLGGTSKQFLNNRSFLRHEVQHILQCKKDGLIKFCIKYVWYSIRYKYKNNPYELDAEAHKSDEFPKDVVIISEDTIVMSKFTFEKLFFISVNAKDGISKAEIERILKTKFKELPYIKIQA